MVVTALLMTYTMAAHYLHHHQTCSQLVSWFLFSIPTPSPYEYRHPTAAADKEYCS
jgi:hypothetical protein